MDEQALRTVWDQARLPLEQEIKLLRAELDTVTRDVALERFQRVQAQRGLVPYVRSLEAFCEWFKALQQPTHAMVITKMIELGIWEIKLGYDPDKDLTLSVASPQRA